MGTKSYTGACLCRTATYRIDWPADKPLPKIVLCHCSSCKRSTGSAFSANVIAVKSGTLDDRDAFTEDHVVYKQFNGIVLAAEEGKNVATALGYTKAALLQNHGLLTVSRTVEETVFWLCSLEKLLADAGADAPSRSTTRMRRSRPIRGDRRYSRSNCFR